MRNDRFVLALSILLMSSLDALTNPFACKRPLPEQKIVGPSELKDFEFVGVVSSGPMWRAVVRWRDHMKTLSVGEQLGSVRVLAIDNMGIRITCENKEFILTIKSE